VEILESMRELAIYGRGIRGSPSVAL